MTGKYSWSHELMTSEVIKHMPNCSCDLHSLLERREQQTIPLIKLDILVFTLLLTLYKVKLIQNHVKQMHNRT